MTDKWRIDFDKEFVFHETLKTDYKNLTNPCKNLFSCIVRWRRSEGLPFPWRVVNKIRHLTNKHEKITRAIINNFLPSCSNPFFCIYMCCICCFILLFSKLTGLPAKNTHTSSVYLFRWKQSGWTSSRNECDGYPNENSFRIFRFLIQFAI